MTNYICVSFIVVIGVTALISAACGFTIHQEASVTLEGTSMLKSKLSLPQLPNLPKFGQSSRPGKNTTSGKNQSKNQQQTSGIPDPTPNFDKQLQHVESIEIITHPNIFVPLANGLAELQLPKNPFGEVPEEQNIKDKDDDIYTVPVAITQTVESKNNSVLAKPVNVQVDRDLPLPAHVPTASTGLGSGGSLTQPSKPEKHGIGGALTTANSIGYATGDNATANTLVANQIELSNSKVVITDLASAEASSGSNGIAFSLATLSSDAASEVLNNGWGKKENQV